MGFLSAMKGANNNWGMCTSSDFKGPCYLGPKNLINNRAQELMITGASLKGEYVFTNDDISNCAIQASGDNWIWFHLEFNDGKTVEFILLPIISKNGTPSTNFLNFIRFIGV